MLTQFTPASEQISSVQSIKHDTHYLIHTVTILMRSNMVLYCIIRRSYSYTDKIYQISNEDAHAGPIDREISHCDKHIQTLIQNKLTEKWSRKLVFYHTELSREELHQVMI